MTLIEIKTEFVAFHCWPKAPKAVLFLRDWHRHRFVVRAKIEVKHNDRELEFFTVKKYIEKLTHIWENKQTTYSCEMFAEKILTYLEDEYGNRHYEIGVWEDDENGSIVITKE